jgi:hypothetical protein
MIGWGLEVGLTTFGQPRLSGGAQPYPEATIPRILETPNSILWAPLPLPLPQELQYLLRQQSHA